MAAAADAVEHGAGTRERRDREELDAIGCEEMRSASIATPGTIAEQTHRRERHEVAATVLFEHEPASGSIANTTSDGRPRPHAVAAR
jgi:hypothetical protein